MEKPLKLTTIRVGSFDEIPDVFVCRGLQVDDFTPSYIWQMAGCRLPAVAFVLVGESKVKESLYWASDFKKMVGFVKRVIEERANYYFAQSQSRRLGSIDDSAIIGVVRVKAEARRFAGSIDYKRDEKVKTALLFGSNTAVVVPEKKGVANAGKRKRG